MTLKNNQKTRFIQLFTGCRCTMLEKQLVSHCFESTAGRYKIKFNDIHKNNMYFPLDNLIRLYVICSLPDKNNFLLKCLLQFCIALIGCPILGFYGENCSIPCPQNCLEGHCDVIEGTCLGCSAGYRGIMCNDSKEVVDYLNQSIAIDFQF